MIYEYQCPECSKIVELHLPVYMRNGPVACEYCFPYHVLCKRILSPTAGVVEAPAAGKRTVRIHSSKP